MLEKENANMIGERIKNWKTNMFHKFNRRGNSLPKAGGGKHTEVKIVVEESKDENQALEGIKSADILQKMPDIDEKVMPIEGKRKEEEQRNNDERGAH